MPRFELVPFRPAHLATLVPGQFDRRALAHPGFRDMLARAQGLSAMAGGRCLGCLVLGIEGGTGTVILIGSEALRRTYGLQLGVLLVRGLANTADLGLRRLRAHVEPDFAVAVRLVARLGFRRLDRITWVRDV